MKLEGGTKPFALFPLCAVLFFCFCSCDPIAAENGLELEGEAKLAGIEETDAVWSEDENVEDIGKLAEDTDEYETAQDGECHDKTSKKSIELLKQDFSRTFSQHRTFK